MKITWNEFKDSLKMPVHVAILIPIDLIRKSGDCRPDHIIEAEFLKEIKKFVDVNFSLEGRNNFNEICRQNKLSVYRAKRGIVE